MSLLITGHRPDGSRVFTDEGAQVGRTYHRRTGGLAVLGGTLVTGEPGAAEKQRASQRAHKARQKGQAA